MTEKKGVKGFVPTQKPIEKTEAEKQAEMGIFDKGESIDNKLELLRYISNVNSRIKDDISSDFILAKLKDKDKEGIIEMTSNAYFVKKVMVMLAEKHKEYKYDTKTKKWTMSHLDTKTKEAMKKIADATFDAYMTRIYMTAILNRNVPRNYLVRLIAGYDDEEEEGETPKDELKGFQKIQNKIRESLGMESAEW
jgi:hypothetical protein